MDDQKAPPAAPETLTGLHRRAATIVNVRGPLSATVPGPDALRLSLTANSFARSGRYQESVIAALAGFRGKRVEVDLGALGYIDSAFCSWLIQIAQQIAPARVVVLGANQRIQDILRHLGMTKMVDIGGAG
jgi:hypothetical protein